MLSKVFERISNCWVLPILLVVVEAFTYFGAIQGDSAAYVNIVRFFRGTASLQEAQVSQWHGILRPIVPILAVPLSFLVSYRAAVALVNVAFLILGTFMMYIFGKRLFSPEVGFVSAVSFASAIPILQYGAAVLTEGAGYAMLITLIYVILFVLLERPDLKTAVFTGILVGIGILTKESNFIALIFLWACFILNRKQLTLSSVITVTVIGILLSFGWAQFVGHSNPLMYYGEGLRYQGRGYVGPLVHPTLFLLSAEYAFGVLLPFAFMGFFYVDNKAFRAMLEVLFSAGVVVLLWPTLPENRLTFLTFPAVLPLAAFAITQASTILAERPFFGKFNRFFWLLLIILAMVGFNNLYGLKVNLRLRL